LKIHFATDSWAQAGRARPQGIADRARDKVRATAFLAEDVESLVHLVKKAGAMRG